MSDDLVERLYDRRVCSPAQNSCRNDWVLDQAEYRIEELEAELADAIRIGKDWFEEQKRAHVRAVSAEAKLAKAVSGLESISKLIDDQYSDELYTQSHSGWENCGDDVKDTARNTLAELKGEK